MRDVDFCECVDYIGAGSGLPPVPFEKWLYIFIHVQRGRPCQLQVSGTPGGQERGLEELLTNLVGGVRDLDSCEFVDFIGVGFGPPQVNLA